MNVVFSFVRTFAAISWKGDTECWWWEGEVEDQGRTPVPCPSNLEGGPTNATPIASTRSAKVLFE